MRLTLTIENQTSLPDGGPLSFTVEGTRGFDFGRDQYLDWALPDPSRFISGKHCEVRAQDGEYLLYDVSRNGTFVNGSEQRMQSPHRLRTGDRLAVGHYLIAVTVEGVSTRPDFGAPEPPQTFATPGANLWNFNDAAPPIDRKDLRAAVQPRPAGVDFLDTSADAFAPLPGYVPSPPLPPFSPPPPPPPPASYMDWDAGPSRVEPVQPSPPPIPRPRPQVVEPGAGGVWSAGPADAPPVSPPPVSAWSDEPVPSPMPVAPRAPEPPPAQRPAPAVEPGAMQGGGAGGDEFVRRFAVAAGIPPEIMSRIPPEELAEKLGQLMRLVTGEMMQLLSARSEARRMTRSSNQTVVQALDNNPLKFSPSPEEALAIFFGPPTRSYLDAQRALKAGFADLKSHQVRTYAAMQQAARRLGDDLSPKTIEASLPPEGGLGAVIGNRRSRLWDTYVARWAASADRHDDGLADVFMQYFAECYDRS